MLEEREGPHFLRALYPRHPKWPPDTPTLDLLDPRVHVAPAPLQSPSAELGPTHSLTGRVTFFTSVSSSTKRDDNCRL